MPSNKQNCWEYMKCGREPDGNKVAELGVCRAVTDKPRNGLNFGTNGCKACWDLVGTFCRGEVQGSFAKTLDSCKKCDFFKLQASNILVVSI